MTQEQINTKDAFGRVAGDIKEIRKHAGLMAYLYPSLQAALDAGAALQCPVLLRPNETITLPSTGIKIDLTCTALKGFNSTLDFPNYYGIAVLGTGPGNGEYSPYHQSWCGMEGVQIKNTVSGNAAIGYKLHAGGEPGPSHISLTKLNISGFSKGLQFGSNAYIVNSTNCDFWNCGTCVDVLNGYNAGERLSFNNCNFFNSNLFLSCDNPNASLLFVQCSADYNKAQIDLKNGRVWFSGHIEGANYTDYVFKVSGQSSLYIENTWMICTSNTTKPTAYFNVTTTANQGGGVWMTNCVYNSCFTTSGYMADGGGNFYTANNSSFDISQNALLSSKVNNKFLDGSFSTGIIDDFLAFGLAARNDRFTATNSVITLSTYGGTPALKHTKSQAAGNGSVFKVYIPVVAGKPYAFEYFFSKNVAVAGSIGFSIFLVGGYYIDAQGYPNHRRGDLIGTEVFPFSAAVVNRKRVASGEPTGRIPAWATHVIIDINATDCPVGDYFFQDFCLTQ